jgi:hypothetical protein
MPKKEKKAITDEEFMNKIIDYCALCALTDWSKEDPKEGFRKLGIIISLFMTMRGWKIK